MENEVMERINACIRGGGRELDFQDLGLKHLPQIVYNLASTVEFINLGGNNLSELPAEFECFQKLRVLFFAGNDFEEIPEVLGRLKSLFMLSFKSNKVKKISSTCLSSSIGWLILTDNEIASLPENFGNLCKLRKCMLACNKLSNLPDSMKNCKQLELLRVSSNRFTRFPEWLFTLPSLSWLALSGNPALPKLREIKMAEIHVDELELKEKLGGGASGEVYRAAWTSNNNKHVAIKIFKGTATSDGSPRDEMLLLMHVGNHRNTVNVLARTVGRGSGGLIFELIPSDFQLLGNTPNFESVTRDTFDKKPSLEEDKILRILKSIASVSAYLHSRGIAHGDLYAHNILVNNDGEAILCDYGAATLYSVDVSSTSSETHVQSSFPLQGIEVRAFGCLIDDLLGLQVSTGSKRTNKFLRELCDDCMKAVAAERPKFSDILKRLESFDCASEEAKLE